VKIGQLLRWRLGLPIPGFNAVRHVNFLMFDEGFWAKIRVGGELLRLFSERNALGVQASVYNENTKKWIAPSEELRTTQNHPCLRGDLIYVSSDTAWSLPVLRLICCSKARLNGPSIPIRA
jgi:hypothetical protein